jgi:hypothetical protein
MEPQDYHYFILHKNSAAVFSFTGYTDKESGILMQIFKGRKEKVDGERVDVPHRWKFDSAHRSIRVHKNDRSILPTTIYDEDGKEKQIFLKSVDFLRGYPSCKGSPNSKGEWMFAEVKEHEDAVTAVEAKEIQLKALNAAMNLDKGDLKEMSALYGFFNTDDAKQKHYLLEKAGANPAEFLEFYDSPERSAKALLKKAISLSIVKVKGTLHVWEKETLGADEALAISKLMSDKDYMEGLKNAVKGIRK